MKKKILWLDIIRVWHIDFLKKVNQGGVLYIISGQRQNNTQLFLRNLFYIFNQLFLFSAFKKN